MEKQQHQNHHHHNSDENHHHRHRRKTWGTWEELVLACAVKRHGSKDWDAVAMEIQKLTNLPHHLTTACNCEQKFLDLERRFADQCNEDVLEPPENGAPAGDAVDLVPWIDELRKLRVAELRQEVQRYDVSILKLQLKVKRLEEEREQNLKENDGERDEKPDLEDTGKPENDEKSGDEEVEAEPASSEPVMRVDDDRDDNDNNNKNKNNNISNNNDSNKLPTGEESDRENQSVNESNSTGSRSVGGKTGEEDVKKESPPVHSGPKEPDPSEGRKVEDSSELRDSVAHSEGETRESSEVQSSTSLTRKRKTRQRKKVSVGRSGGQGAPENDEVDVKSQLLVGVLELIKRHENSPVFERRLESQRESETYKNIVRQHIDLDTIQTRLRNGSYSSCTYAFFRDLLLLLTNATIFFPTDSVESRAALKLRRLVNVEIKNHIRTHQPDPPLAHNTDHSLPPPPPSSQTKPESSLLSKHKASAPILVCRKRTSISAKPSSFGQKSGDSEKKPASDSKPPQKRSPLSDDDSDEDELPPPPPKTREKPVTGARSLRRSNKNLTGGAANPNKKLQTSGSTPKASSPKPDHKSKATAAAAVEASVSDKKRSAAADFLKRIKRTGPADALRSGGGGSSSSKGGGGSSGKDQKKVMSSGKNEKGKERVLRHSGGGGDRKNDNTENNSSQSKRSVGRPPKKTSETNASVSAKRGRENSSGGKDKRPKKRTRK